LLTIDALSGVSLTAQVEKFLFHSSLSTLDASHVAEVSDSDKVEMLPSGTWDIDFVSITGEMKDILGDLQVAQLLGNCSGKILSCCSMQNVRTETFGRMLMFTKLGDWMLGKNLFIFRRAFEALKFICC
jgi:hypothetical protein